MAALGRYFSRRRQATCTHCGGHGYHTDRVGAHLHYSRCLECAGRGWVVIITEPAEINLNAYRAMIANTD